MSLLTGFKMRSESNERGYFLQELNNLSFAGSDLSGEPGLAEMLVDPVVLSVMHRDGVGADEGCNLFRMKRKIAA